MFMACGDLPATVGMKKETMCVATEECLDALLDTGLKPDIPGLSMSQVNGNVKGSGKCMQGSHVVLKSQRKGPGLLFYP